MVLNMSWTVNAIFDSENEGGIFDWCAGFDNMKGVFCTVLQCAVLDWSEIFN